MQRTFSKMHGLGNDFAIFDVRDEPLDAPLSAGHAAALCDRHRGIGCDQLILIEPSTSADLAMRIYNADGSEVESCGNALRCVATLYPDAAAIETRGGIVHTDHSLPHGHTLPAIDMGAPRFAWQDIPLAFAMDTNPLPAAWDDLAAPSAINVGNPHLVFIVDDVDAVALDAIGPRIEQDALFPNRINVNIISVVDRRNVRHRVWERGSGLTQACGTGACASAVAAIRAGLVDSPVTVHMPGGPLDISWAPGTGILMRGGATHVYDGVIKWPA